MDSLINIKGVIFDMDGTLLDSMPVWNQVAASYLIKKGYQPEANLWEQLKFLSLAQGVTFIKKQYGLLETNEEIEKEINLIIENSYFNEIPMKPGVKTYLQLLRSCDVQMCVATATDKYLAEACLKRLHIRHYFKAVMTCKEVGRGKDTPAIFEKALDCLGTLREETYVFEDALHAAITAKNAGFRVVGVYDATAEGDWDTLRKIADRSIFSMEELL